ncbi:ankyrin repeat domain-containing protein [Actinoplanes rectilineatus]|uniref:ankyrin repeat domain-containing protein n=1 Tax=Actinoplanes rectilineatus TaxID=113571 RepID=UPI0005F2ABB5|nr:ankyrin repeat domain-containing protein [Actinoplanes rectilineatus]
MTADQRLADAVAGGDEAAAGRALADGANPDSPGTFAGTVLVEAARAGHLEIVRLLLGAGARILPSVLRGAVVNGRSEVARLLVRHGALAGDDTRPSVLVDAVAQARFRPRPAALATLRVLLGAGAIPAPGEEDPIVTATMTSTPPAVLRLLLEHGTGADVRRSDGTPAIVVAARRGDHAAVDVLVQAGADVDARDPQGRTALMHAAERDEQRVVAVLLTAGADAAVVSEDGMTALRLAQGWQHQSVQYRLGENRAGAANVPITRTVVRTIPTGVRLTGDPSMLALLAGVVDVAVAEMGDTEWEAGSGLAVETARAVSALLREPVPADGASWYQVDVGAGEFAAARWALAELAYGTPRPLPDGVDRLWLIDVLEELRH